MIQTINPYATARTAEIMSRYRPIAPKPESPSTTTTTTTTTDNDQNSNLPRSIRNSPYLRNVWAHLQARPTRTRKRGRTAAFAPPPPPPPINRTKTCLQGISPVFQLTNIDSSAAKNLSIHGFGPSPNGIFSFVQVNSIGLDTAVTNLEETVAALSCTTTQIPIQGIDLNLEVENNQVQPKELDFMPQLKKPVKQGVIAPHPVRPIGSNILVNSINEDPGRPSITAKKPEEVEKEVNEEEVPAIVSDSGNRVRLANSSYKEMVGQPECGWLDCVAASGGARRRRRIGGEVVLRFGDSSEVEKMSMMRGGFNCRVRIEWERNGGDKCCLDAFCSGIKILECEGKDYQFLWRFYTQKWVNLI